MRGHFLVVVLLLGCSKPAVSVQGSPEATAQAFGDALKANDWAAAARIMHPEALRQLRAMFAPILQSEGSEQLSLQFFGVGSHAEFAALPDTVMFASFLRSVVTQQEAGLAEALRTMRFTPLGHVNGGGDTVLVVSRMEMSVEKITISQFEVMPFTQHEGHWRGLLKADFTNLAAMLKRSLGAQS